MGLAPRHTGASRTGRGLAVVSPGRGFDLARSSCKEAKGADDSTAARAVAGAAVRARARVALRVAGDHGEDALAELAAQLRDPRSPLRSARLGAYLAHALLRPSTPEAARPAMRQRPATAARPLGGLARRALANAAGGPGAMASVAQSVASSDGGPTDLERNSPPRGRSRPRGGEWEWEEGA